MIFRKLTLTAGITAMTFFAAPGMYADEVQTEAAAATTQEAASSSMHIWQGYGEAGAYTFFLDTDTLTASASVTSSDGTLSSVSGTYTIDESGTLRITSEDGTSSEWPSVSVSSCQDMVTVSEGDITAVKGDPAIAKYINGYAWYAGLSDEGDAYTYGISLDCTKLVFGFYTPGDDTLYETRFSLDITDSGDGALSGIATDEAGISYAFSYEMIDSNPVHATITLNDESCETSAVEARIFPDYSDGESG